MPVMTKLLERALNKISRLPGHVQDEIAQIIINEIESERKWDASFAKSQGFLEKLAVQAIAENRAGKTRALKI